MKLTEMHIFFCRKWENLPAGFKQLKLDKMDGKNLMNKIELLMAALSNSQ